MFVFEENVEKLDNVDVVNNNKVDIDSIVDIYIVKKEVEGVNLSIEDCINQIQKKIVINDKMLGQKVD